MEVSSSSPEFYHWMLLEPLGAVSLYATADCQSNRAVLQWILPGFASQWRTYSKDFTMKGMWANDKSENATYRVASDALNSVPEGLLASVLLAVVESGCALMVSCTRDKGALCLTLLDGERRHRVYPTGAAELIAALTDLRDSLTETEPNQVNRRAKKP